MEIDVDGGERITLAPWQAVVIPAGTLHRTRAIGRTVNATFERQGVRTVFVERPAAAGTRENDAGHFLPPPHSCAGTTPEDLHVDTKHAQARGRHSGLPARVRGGSR